MYLLGENDLLLCTLLLSVHISCFDMKPINTERATGVEFLLMYLVALEEDTHNSDRPLILSQRKLIIYNFTERLYMYFYNNRSTL